MKYRIEVTGDLHYIMGGFAKDNLYVEDLWKKDTETLYDEIMSQSSDSNYLKEGEVKEWGQWIDKRRTWYDVYDEEGKNVDCGFLTAHYASKKLYKADSKAFKEKLGDAGILVYYKSAYKKVSIQFEVEDDAWDSEEMKFSKLNNPYFNLIVDKGSLMHEDSLYPYLMEYKGKLIEGNDSESEFNDKGCDKVWVYEYSWTGKKYEGSAY